MRRVEKREYPPPEAYEDLAQAFLIFIGLLLFSMARFPETIKIRVISNFLARSNTMLQGVLKLWSIEDYQDCWILYRCMLDRLFHLNELIIKNEFEAFEAWSFQRQYNARHSIRSDERFKDRIDPDFFRDTEEEKARIKEFSTNSPHWKRPRPEDVAKRMNLQFLYKLGYDYGSMHVHPMANDGLRDFIRLTGLGNEEIFPDERVVLNNACLATLLIIQESMVGSGLLWRGILHDFLENVMRFFEIGSEDYKLTLERILYLDNHATLCEAKEDQGAESR